MQKKNSAEIVISAYNRAEADADILLKYIEGINSLNDINDESLPQLVQELQDKDSSKTQEYMACASLMGGGVASAVGTTLACGALTAGAVASGVTAPVTAISLAATYGAFAGIGSVIPVISWFVIPVASIATIAKLLNDSKVRHYKKHKEKIFRTKKKSLEEAHNKLQGLIDSILRKIDIIERKLKEDLKKKIYEYQTTVKELSEAIKREIQNLVNVGENERILRYNEIILKQYKLQRELEDKLDFLYSEYDKLLKEKAKLERKIAILMQLLNTMGCPESIINQALSE